MLGWFQAMMPREARFFDLFKRHAGTLVDGAEALKSMLDGTTTVADGCERIVRHEHLADEIARETLQAVRRTFITPFDRTDIRAMATSLDDAIDQMQKTAKTIVMFEVTAFEPGMKEMGDLIVTVAHKTFEAVSLLGAMRENGAKLHAIAEEIVQLEEKADGLHEEGLKALYAKCRSSDPMGFIVGGEIYGHLEKVMDRFEDVANGISDLLIEHL